MVGQFSGEKKSQQIVVCTGSTLDVYVPNVETGKLVRVGQQPAFATIQEIAKIRLHGTQRDLLVISSDSGKMVVAQYNSATANFEPVIQEPHSKNGLARTTPGEYLSVALKGVAIMCSAIERTKLVYRVETVEGKMALSSPLETSDKGVLTLQITAMDSGVGNPVWAALETRYGSSGLALNYYEFDQGLNHVTRRRGSSLPSSANYIMALPAPMAGLLVACERYLRYEKENNEPIYVPLPVRKGAESTIIVAHTVHVVKKAEFLILVQSTLGDLFKIAFEFDSDRGEVANITATYFDTIPSCNSLVVLKSGFLFAAVADNSKLLYQFESLGSTNETTLAGSENVNVVEERHEFLPVGLQNLALVDILESLSPLVDAVLAKSTTNANSDPLTQIVTASSKSYLKTLTHGLAVSELVALPIPLAPTSIFTVGRDRTVRNDEYLVLSSEREEKTLVLSIGEVVEEVSTSGLVLDQLTRGVWQVGHRSVVQVHGNGLRHVKYDEKWATHTTDWFPPAGISVVHASANNQQVVLGLSNREVCYFEVAADDQLVEYQGRYEVGGGAITAMAVASDFFDDSESRSPFCMVGAADETLVVLSLRPHDTFAVLSIQALSAAASGLLLLPKDKDTYYAHMGMASGVYVRIHVDMATGKLSDTRLKYLGTKPVTLRSMKLPNVALPAVLAFSSRPWACFFRDEQFRMAPLLGTDILGGASIYSEDIGVESVVGFAGANLTIFTVGETDNLGVEATKLRYSPRKLLKDGELVYVLESEHAIRSPYDGHTEVDVDLYDAFGYDRAPGWASCVQIVNTRENAVVCTHEMRSNASLVSACFHQNYFVVGASYNQTFSPPSASGHAIHVLERQKKDDVPLLSLVHSTDIDAAPSAMISFHGKILVAAGRQLRLYEIGKKQLLRKLVSDFEFLHRVSKIIHVGGDVVVVGDAGGSVCYFQFESSRNEFVAMGSDSIRRQVTSMALLDNRTVVGGDKFGNIFVLRMDMDLALRLQENVQASQAPEYLNGAPFRLSPQCEFYINDVPTSLQKGSFVVGGVDSVIYTGIHGTVGIMLPLGTKQEVQMMLKFQDLMRDQLGDHFDDDPKRANLVGREHAKYRGYYNPCKNVIDGDLVERFLVLDAAARVRIASSLERTPADLERKLHDLRHRAAF